MKLLYRYLVLAGILVLALSVTVSSVAAGGPYNGFWQSTDIDGSHQTLAIGGGPGGSHHVRYHDFGATACGLDPDTGTILYAATATGMLSTSGGDLVGTLPVYCQTAPPTFLFNHPFSYSYDAITDTLLDGEGVTWSRP